MIALFQRTCDHGIIFDERKYKPLTKIIHEFKSRHIRVLSFRLPADQHIEIVITDYFKKPQSKKLYNPHIERSEKIAKKVIKLYLENKLKMIKG